MSQFNELPTLTVWTEIAQASHEIATEGNRYK